ncbi:MAG TPA: hypothetical protein VHM70_16220 [Polyangiaceae bacterium]|jgi:hypothetical protein|nr:hypothetical protein [Polyangiaceae bacterium]
MDVKLLIDGIVRQTTVLIAQLSTSAGIRAPLAHIADQVFVELAQEIESHGVTRKVAADMFGLALRSYQKKVQRLTESATVRDRTLWEAVLDFLSERGSVTRGQLFERFSGDSTEDLGAVLNDLTGQGVVYATGRGLGTVYGLSSASDRRQVAAEARTESAQALVWLSLYRQPMSRRDLCGTLPLDALEVDRALEALAREGRIREDRGKFRADTFIVPLGATRGWEVAVFDHFSAVVRAIAAKLRGGAPQAGADDVIGGATLTFEVSPTHPQRAEVRGLLRRIRQEVNELWFRVGAHNDAHPIADGQRELVTFYFGQNTQEAEDEPQE